MSSANTNPPRRIARLFKRLRITDLIAIGMIVFVVLYITFNSVLSLGYIGLERFDEPEALVPPPLNSSLNLSTNGDTVVFRYGTALYAVDSSASRLYPIPDGPSANDDWADYLEESSPDLSPDGSKVVYLTHRFSDGPFWDRVHRYEFAVSSLDGKDTKRLAVSTGINGFAVLPSWSPDGNYIAFIHHDSHPTRREGLRWDRHLYGMYADGTHSWRIAPAGYQSNSATRPVWSPDGLVIAFRDEVPYFDGRTEHVFDFVTVSEAFYEPGSSKELESRRIVESESPIGQLTWSPDGRSLAFTMGEENSTALYTVAPDGSNLRRVVADTKTASSGEFRLISLLPISWSPDGSEIRFFARTFATEGFGLHSVEADGSGVRTLQEGLLGSVAWSRDGSRIAVYLEPPQTFGYRYSDVADMTVVLYTSAPDGSDRRDLVRYVNGELVAENSGWRDEFGPDCSSGRAVPNPGRNPGLVDDCETLLSVRDTLVGEGVEMNWSTIIPVDRWDGIVSVDGSPRRVRHLALTELAGTLSRELGKLTGLRRLHLVNGVLTGKIPSELGNLGELEELSLGNNQLSGTIPPELGNLGNLGVLRLDNNKLDGNIPVELGNLANLELLRLDNNKLDGNIPVELGNLKKLERILLHNNRLTGCIPLSLSGKIVVTLEPLEFCAR